MDVSVILSTYNAPEWLEKVVWGYAVQSYRRFELVIADDGGGNGPTDPPAPAANEPGDPSCVARGSRVPQMHDPE